MSKSHSHELRDTFLEIENQRLPISYRWHLLVSFAVICVLTASIAQDKQAGDKKWTFEEAKLLAQAFSKRCLPAIRCAPDRSTGKDRARESLFSGHG